MFSEKSLPFGVHPKVCILPELHGIFLDVAPCFESCTIHFTKLNDVSKVA